MITLFSKLFIKDTKNTTAPETRQAYGVLCGTVGIFLNICLCIGKFIAGILSHSIAITADAINNLSDAGSSLITLIGFRMAGQKPDVDHPYGHGRIEYISGLLVSVAIIFMGFELVKSSVNKIIKPVEITSDPVVIGILIVSICIKLYMAYYNTVISKKIDSAAMKATATDSLSDSLSTLVVLISTLVCHFTSLNIDGYCGVLVGCLILYAGYSAAKDTISPLLGQPPKKEFIEQIENLVNAHAEVLGIHDLIVHDYGPGRVMVSLHAEVDSRGDLMEMHDMIDNIEKELATECHCEAVIHMDPILVDDPLTDSLHAQVNEILMKLDDTLKLHDFRVVSGPTHTNIIFDILLPYEYKMTDSEVVSYLSKEIHNINANYYAVIQVDKAYYSK
ncbi:MAG: cation transporter [Lachnospiraceae bacterium]|nr:cation transporter [Lachnospiraceae bacterium]